MGLPLELSQSVFFSVNYKTGESVDSFQISELNYSFGARFLR
jgi:hypothetical protein